MVVNPFGVNLQMPITKRTVPNPEAAAHADAQAAVQATQVEVNATHERAGAEEGRELKKNYETPACPHHGKQ